MRKPFLAICFLFLFSGSSTSFAQQWGDYTLYGTMGGSNAYLVDTNGATYHTWTFSATNHTGYSTYMMPGGTLVRSVSHAGNSFTGGGMTGQVQKVDWNGNITWDYVYSTAQYCMHHDICPMPNGNVMLISYELKSSTEVTAAGSSSAITMWPDKIVEVQPTGATTGTIVWEWHVWDHLVQNVDSNRANYFTSIVDHPERLNINYQTQKDWMHMNGIDYNALLDQIVVSSHNMDEMYVIDHSTTTQEAAGSTGGNSGKGGDFLYRWGNPVSYQATGTVDFNVMHDAHWIPQDCPRAGYLVGYNNNGISNNQSCVDMIYPPYDGYNYQHTAGTAYAPSTYDFRHACNGHNGNMGNSQQLPNGNMLICIAQSGYIYEIDSSQNILWSKTVSGTTPHAYRYSACYTAGTQPVTPLITNYSDTLVSSTTAATYVWYLNGAVISGATDQNYIPTLNGSYQVQAVDSGGCASAISFPYLFLSTSVFNVTQERTLKLYPNPSSGIVKIEGAFSYSENYEIFVTDQVGKTILHVKNQKSVDLSGYENGLYHFILRTAGGKTLTQKFTLIK
ncbi:hypothetical protein BH11BAC1_BH11BAC1_08850 [soil metagenome]